MSFHHRSSLEPRWTKKSNLSLIEVRVDQCRSKRLLAHLGKSSPQKVGIFSPSTNSTIQTPKDLELLGDSSLISLKKTITISQLVPFRASKGRQTESETDRSQFGLSLLPNITRWQLLCATPLLSVPLSSQASHKTQRCLLRKTESAETESTSKRFSGGTWSRGRNKKLLSSSSYLDKDPNMRSTWSMMGSASDMGLPAIKKNKILKMICRDSRVGFSKCLNDV